MSNILKLKTSVNKFFVFDGLSNEFYEVESEEDLADVGYAEIGYDSGIRSALIIDKDRFLDINTKAKTLVLELTSACNIRCNYCVFENKNSYFERKHGAETLAADTAYDAIKSFL